MVLEAVYAPGYGCKHVFQSATSRYRAYQSCLPLPRRIKIMSTVIQELMKTVALILVHAIPPCAHSRQSGTLEVAPHSSSPYYASYQREADRDIGVRISAFRTYGGLWCG